MFDYLKDNWRDLLTVALFYLGFAFLADMAAWLAEGSGVDLFHLVNALGGVAKLILVVASVWFVLAVTLPDSLHQFITKDWDDGWASFGLQRQFLICIGFVSVLLVVAALCLA